MTATCGESTIFEVDSADCIAHNVSPITYGITTSPTRMPLASNGSVNHSALSTTGVWDTVPFWSNVAVPRTALAPGATPTVSPPAFGGLL